MRLLAAIALLSPALSAEIRPMTLKQAVEAALRQSPDLALARLDEENARRAAIAVTGKRDEVAWRVADLFLDAERAARVGALARKDAESQEKVLATVQVQVREGRALPLAEKTAAYQLAYARQMALNL